MKINPLLNGYEEKYLHLISFYGNNVTHTHTPDILFSPIMSDVEYTYIPQIKITWWLMR